MRYATWLHSAVAVGCALVLVRCADAEDIKSVIEAVRASEAQVADVKAEFEMYWSNREDDPHYSTCNWAFRSDYRQRLEGIFRRKSKATDKEYDITIVSAFDGEKFRRNRVENNRGIVKADVYEIENEGPNPKTFLGYSLTSRCPQYASLADCLALASEARVVDPGAMVGDRKCIQVEAVFPKAGNPEQAAHRMVVWLDPKCGYRPRQIDLYRNDYNVLFRRLDEIELEEVSPGIWLPMAGNDRWYGMSEVKASHPLLGDDVKAILSLPQEERRAALTVEPIEVDVSKRMMVKRYEVNTGLPDSLFTYEFPKGCAVWDDFLNEGFWSGVEVDKAALDGLATQAGLLSTTAPTATVSGGRSLITGNGAAGAEVSFGAGGDRSRGSVPAAISWYKSRIFWVVISVFILALLVGLAATRWCGSQTPAGRPSHE